jgi:hypothetical protein
MGWLEETWDGLGRETCRGERHCSVRKGILRAESVAESAILLRADACEEPFGAVMEVKNCFVRGDTSTCACRSQELRLFGKIIKTSWRENTASCHQ